MSQTRPNSLSAYARDWAHLRKEHLVARKEGAPEDLQPTLQKSEAWCTECDNRVTDGTQEWGHATDCSHHCAGGVR